jgi:hypothetical protein
VNWLVPDGVGDICRVRWSGAKLSQGKGSQGTGMVSKQIESHVAFYVRTNVSAGLAPVEQSSGFRFAWFPIELLSEGTAPR